MLAFHGTQNDFTEFNHDFIGQHATGEGFGFYFTDSESLARSYANNNGYVISANLSLKKGMSLTDKNITYKQFKRFLKTLDPTGENYLSNWGDITYDGYNTVLEIAASAEYFNSDNDVDLISSVINAGGNSIKEIYVLIDKMFEYDHIRIDNWGDLNCTVFVVFQPEQIKIINKLEVIS